MHRISAVVIALAACNGGTASTSTSQPAPPPTLVTPVDAAPPDGSTALPDTDPALHLDPDETETFESSEPGPTQPRARSRRILEILLRSSPPGATAIVDGRVIGTTPTYWEGEFTGHEREFTFVLPGHTLARYRFVPIQNGIVHARLTPVLSDVPGATPPLVLPQLPKLAPDQRKPAATPPDAAPAPESDAAPTDDAAPATTLPPPPALPDATP